MDANLEASGGGSGSGGSADEGGHCAAPLSFDDAKVEAEVRNRAGVASRPLTPEDVASVTGIVADGANSLAGLECLPKLESVVARGGGITDLSPLSDHSSLSQIDISTNPIQSLTGLSLGPPPSCDSEVNLQGCPVSDGDIKALCAIRQPNAMAPYDGWYVTWTAANGGVTSCNQPCLTP